MPNRLTILLLLAFAAAGATGGEVSEQTVFAYPQAIRISDGALDAVVVPAFARIARFGRVGGANLLFENSRAERCLSSWYNPGGDRLWPWPQASWRPLAGRAWPPPVGCDGPMTATTPAPGRVRLVGMLPSHAVRMIREVSLVDGSLRSASRFERVAGATVDAPVAVWQICQLPQPTHLEIRAASVDAANAAASQAGAWCTARTDKEVLILAIDPARGGELVLQATVLGWRAPDGSGLALIRHGVGGPAKIWVGCAARDGENAEPPSSELEFTSPERALAPGEAIDLVTELRPLAAGEPLPAARPSSDW
ncbi:MAG TPA: hypothetical protein DCS97_11165 [Planctomycetes bacterium]|nr:hypothetical protein [Planctomycetota bacterium]